LDLKDKFHDISELTRNMKITSGKKLQIGTTLTAIIHKD
jgi:hypothetical protein